jgi:general stress protein CsbA
MVKVARNAITVMGKGKIQVVKDVLFALVKARKYVIHVLVVVMITAMIVMAKVKTNVMIAMGRAIMNVQHVMVSKKLHVINVKGKDFISKNNYFI